MAAIGAAEEYANLSQILWKARQLSNNNCFRLVLIMKNQLHRMCLLLVALDLSNGHGTEGQPTSDRTATKVSICSIPNSKNLTTVSFGQEKKQSFNNYARQVDCQGGGVCMSLKSLYHLVSSCLSSLSSSPQSWLSLRMSEFCHLKTSRWIPPPPPSRSSWSRASLPP